MTRKPPPSFGEWLAAHMQANPDLTRAADLARATGVSETNISRYLRGLQPPDIENARKLANGLGRPVLEVLVVAGHISPEEAALKDTIVTPAPTDHMRTPEGKIVATLTDRADAKTRKLIAEMVRRLSGDSDE